MQHPLQQQIEQIRGAARRVRISHALGWLVATALAAGLILGLADFLLRSEELGVRLLFSAAMLGAVGWTVWRFLLPAISNRSTIVQVAQRIEQRWPQLEDRLSSSLEFLAQEREDPTAGSPALRRTVVAEATAQIDGLPLSEVVDRRRPRPVLITAGVLLLVVVMLSLAAPQVAARAARRLAMPWSLTDAWPRRHELAFVDPPTHVPYGEPFRAELKDNKGQPPELVEIYYWFEGQLLADVQPQPMQHVDERLVHQLPRVTQPFKYRAVGGDDETMDWHTVEVVEPPRIESLNITLHPPDYTARPPHESSRHIRAIAGTSVSLAGVATKPIVSARLVIESSEAASGEAEQEIELTVGDDDLSFALPASDDPAWQLTTAGSYRLILVGEEGVESGLNDRYQLNVSPDAPPRVSVDLPEANAFVTANALVPIQAQVSDDLAIARIELRWLRSDDSDTGEQVIVLYEGPATAPPPSNRANHVETRDVDFTWDLTDVGDLSPDTSLMLTIAATDYRPQEELSPPRRITIITPDQLEDRIVQRQVFLLGQLAEALAIQREARLQSQAIEIQFEKTGELSPGDLVDIQSAELNQRRVDRLLSGENDGVLAQIDALLEVARQNRLDNPDLERRIAELRKAISLITTNQLPAIGGNLLSALKAGQSAMHGSGDKPVGGAPLSEVRQAVGEAGRGQERVIEQLERLLGNLSQWDSYRRFSRQVSALRRDQQNIAEQTDQLRGRTLSKTMQQLTAQDKADLAKLSQRQSELARRLERMLSQMEQMRDELSDDPVAAQTLGDAVEMARQRGTSGQMRQTAGQIESNQIGQATKGQQQVSQQLDELLDMLTGRREHQLERRLEQLQEADAELQELRAAAQGLRDKQDAAAQNRNEEEKRRQLQRLEAERQQQQEQIERLARKLERLQAEQAAQSLSQAAEHSQQSGEAAGQGDDEKRKRESDLAEEDLTDAQQKLQQQIKQVQQDLLEEQLARLEQSLKSMVDQQQGINDETLRLDGLKQQSDSLTRGQLASVRTLAQQQRGLMAETSEFADQVAAAEVFHLGLTGAMREMALVIPRLEDVDTGRQTQQAEARALQRLEQLLTAMQEDESDQPPEQNAGSGSGGDQGESPDGIRNVAQLKLLKLMQESLQQRTGVLEQIRETGGWTESHREEIVQLAQEQGQLAELLLKLSEPPSGEMPEDDPESLPDFGEELDQELQDILDEFNSPEE